MDVLEICAKMIRNAVGTMSTKFSAHVKDEINAKVSTLYKPGGNATLATLPALTADNAGYVYDMSEAFTTTASFREGAGHKYPAGTNVVVSDVGNGVYKYDVLSGMLDGYVQESRKIGNVPLSADIPVTLTGDTAITVTNTGTASAIGYSVAHEDSGVTAGSKGDTTNQTPGFGGTFKALSATVDAKGHVTALGDHTVKVPSDTATTSKDGLMSKTDKAKLDAIGVTASAPLEVTKTGETYNVTLKDSGVTAGSKGDTTNQTPGFGGTFKALSATVDAKGRITSLAEHSVKTPDTEATQSAKGLMSASDKTKLDTLVDDTLSTTGKAADAKVTGDNVALLKELIQGIDAPIYRTASGNPATFSDGAAANVKALSVEITPTQSGSGDPYPPGGGKNLIAPYRASGFSTMGITFTLLPDGGYQVTGTPTETNLIGLAHVWLDSGSYIFSSGNAERGLRLGAATPADVESNPGTVGGYINYPMPGGQGAALTVTERKRYTLSVAIGEGEPVNSVVYPMCRLASDADPTFAPYSNIRPISGVSSVAVTRTGANGANPQTVTVQLTDGANPLTVYGGTLNVTTGELTVTRKIVVLTSSMNTSLVDNNRAFAVDNSAFYDMYINKANSTSNRSGIFSSHFIESTQAEISSGRDRIAASSWGSGTKFLYFSSALAESVAAFKSFLNSQRDAGTPVQVCYPLAEPVTYQLTPAQLDTLSGYNAVSSDAGTVNVTYKADTAITLGGG